MKHIRARRSLLKGAAAGLAASWAGRTLAQTTKAGPPASPEGTAGPASPPSQAAMGPVSAYAADGKIWVRIGEQAFTCYRADAAQKYPYFYPLLGPASGLPMTEETCLPWPHHRSIFLACDRVNGDNYWQEGNDRGQIVSRGPVVAAEDAQRAVITDRCDWRRPGQPPVMEDGRTFTVRVLPPDVRCIDADITIRALVDVRIEKTNHSLFAIRVARGLTPLAGGTLVNANGHRGEKETDGDVGPWCGFAGSRLGVAESIVLMDHPGNPWFPCRWSTRDYGFISPTPFFWLDERGWTLPAGRTVHLRYRVLAAAGPIDIDRMNEIHAEWADKA